MEVANLPSKWTKKKNLYDVRHTFVWWGLRRSFVEVAPNMPFVFETRVREEREGRDLLAGFEEFRGRFVLKLLLCCLIVEDISFKHRFLACCDFDWISKQMVEVLDIISDWAKLPTISVLVWAIVVDFLLGLLFERQVVTGSGEDIAGRLFVSKVRTTSRRSRRPASKNLKMGQQQGDGSPKQPDVAVSQCRLSENIEHVPIKKRRFHLRPPSPPPRTPCPKEPVELDDGPHDYERQTLTDPVAEKDNIEVDSSNAAAKAVQSICDDVMDSRMLNSACDMHNCNDDFSGIAILADAACSDSLENSADGARRSSADEFLKQELHPFAPVMATTSNTACFELSNSIENVHGSVEGSMASLSNDIGKANDTANVAKETKRSSGASRDDKLLWDLNVVMDEWDHPLDDTIVDSGLNLKEGTTLDSSHNQKFDNAEGNGPRKESENIESTNELTLNASFCKLPTSEVLPDLTYFACGTLVLNSKEHSSETSSAPERSFLQDDRVPCTATSHAMETSTLVLDSKVQIRENNEVTNSEFSPRSDDMKTWLSVSNHNVQDTRNSTDLINKDSASGVQVGQVANLCVKMNGLDNIKEEPCEVACEPVDTCLLGVGKREIVFLQPSRPGNVASETSNLPYREVEEHVKRSDLNHGVNESRIVHMSDLEQVGIAHCVIKHEDMSQTFVASANELLSETAEVKEMIGCASTVDAFRHDQRPVDAGSELLMQTRSEHSAVDEPCRNKVNSPGNHLGKIASKDCLEGDLNTHISQEDRSQVEITTEQEGGYDSHLEDGELRESVGLFWEENDGDEAERVDYESDNGVGYDITNGANDSFPPLGKVLVGAAGEKRRSFSDQCGCKDEQLTSEKSTGETSYRSCPGSLSADVMERDYSKSKSSTSRASLMTPLKGISDHEGVETELNAGRKSNAASDDSNKCDSDASENVGNIPSGVRILQVRKRELQSQIEGPTSSDRKDAGSVRRSRSGISADIYDGHERQTGSDESMGKGRSSLHLDGGDRLRNRSWNFGPKSVAVTSAATEGGDSERFQIALDNTSPRVRRPTMIPTSKHGYPHLVRKGLPAERDDDYLVGMGKVKMRDISPDNTMRRRFHRYPIRINRGSEEGYQRPGLYETSYSPGTLRNHFVKRERNFSPIPHRMNHLAQSHRRSGSRSKSCSPDYSPEGRTGRMRMPYQPASRRSPARMLCPGQRFDAMDSPGRLRPDDCLRPMMRPVRFSDMASSARSRECEDGDDYKRKHHFHRTHRRSDSRSVSRSPEFRSEARIGTMRMPYQPRAANHIRDRSPVRAFRPGQRFDTMRSPDDYLRPNVRPVRFHEAAHSGRGNEFDGDDLRRKPRKIFERIHPMRHYDMDSDVRRFEYDMEDMNSSHGFRNADRRSGDILRSNREERGSARYNPDHRVYYSGPRPLVVRDYSDDDAHHRTVRP
ncbi:hypothetical protein Nepgr_010801 [Nepenthes gracilis]|uniref:Uncharacterized protein n=1 Tax=Nepenthes gracilis TaxID=150966 RepID=A0AAD3SDV8_NEPGR|nr:hypothetical protein Nepgr_010801 [Nepenthes gracilis]